MRAPYGLNIIDNCVTCPVREEHLFCNLPAAAVQKLNRNQVHGCLSQVSHVVY